MTAVRAALSSALFVLASACHTDDGCDPNAVDTICTIAGVGRSVDPAKPTSIGETGPATEAFLYVPIDLAMSPSGELWVIDFNNYLIRAIDARGIIRTVAGNGLIGDDPTAGAERVPAVEATLNHTTDLLFDGDYVYLAAWHNSRVKRIRLSDMTLENFAGRGVRTRYDGDGGPALDAAFDLPAALAIDPAGNVSVTDQANQVIRQIDGNGVIRTIAGKCVVDLEAPCTNPVACGGGSAKFACGDVATTCAHQCNPGFAGDDGPARDARLAFPYGAQADPAGHMAYTRDGDLLFADSGNHRIRRIDARTRIITTIAGIGLGHDGRGGYAGDGGLAAEAQLNYPLDLEVTLDGTIYFTDVKNNCVRRIDPSGIISTVVGQCSPNPANRGFAGDGGPPREALLDRPYGIALAGNKLFVADTYNYRVRVVNLPD